jgi:hypothetical protein
VRKDKKNPSSPLKGCQLPTFALEKEKKRKEKRQKQ